jgi:hypothetical protein
MAVPPHIQQLIFRAAKDPYARAALSAAGRRGGAASAAARAIAKERAKELADMIRPKTLKELLAAHMKHPDVKHVQSWVDKAGQAIPDTAEAATGLRVDAAPPVPPKPPATAKALTPAIKPKAVPGMAQPQRGDTPEAGEEKISVHLVNGRVKLAQEMDSSKHIRVSDVYDGKYGLEPDAIAANLTKRLGTNVAPHMESLQQIAKQEISKQPLTTKLKLLPDLGRIALGREPKIQARLDKYMDSSPISGLSVNSITHRYPVPNAAYTNLIRNKVISPLVSSIVGGK